MQTPRYPSLRDYLHVLRVSWLAIVAVTATGGAVAYVVSQRQDTRYEASALMAFEDETRELSLLGFPVSAQVAPDQLPSTRAQAINDLDVAQAVRANLKSKSSAAELAAGIRAGVTDAGLVQVTARDGDPTRALTLANAFAREARDRANADARRRFAVAAREVKARIKRLGDGARAVPLRGVLTDQLARLVFLRTSSEPAQIIRRARGVVEDGPEPARDTGIGLALGLVLAIVAAFVRDALDRRLRGTQAIEARLGIPLLGRVRAKGLGHPVAPTDSANARVAPDVESFRIVRQNLEFLTSTPLKLVAVTSATSDEGKSTVAASLAAAVAATGKRTLVIECDLRRPSLTARFDVAATPGVTDLLAGDVERNEVLQPLRPKALRRRRGRQAERTWPDNLLCITAGRATDQPAEMLGSKRFHELLSEVSSAYDLVILDTAPLLPVADTLELLPLVDGIVLCVRSGRTTLEQAAAGKAAMDHFPDRPIGLVVTGLRPPDEQEYDTYYAPSRATIEA